MISACGRPENFGELIIRNWQRLVAPHDFVYHLGDVIFRRPRELETIMKQLPGVHVLVKGNHDEHSDEWFREMGFHFVCQQLVVDKVMLSHYPLPVPPGVEFAVHGHFHNNPGSRWERELVALLEPRHRLFCLENEKYRPQKLKDFLGRAEPTLQIYERTKHLPPPEREYEDIFSPSEKAYYDLFQRKEPS